jgi:translation initiation factor 3 subunit L
MQFADNNNTGGGGKWQRKKMGETPSQWQKGLAVPEQKQKPNKSKNSGGSGKWQKETLKGDGSSGSFSRMGMGSALKGMAEPQPGELGFGVPKAVRIFLLEFSDVIQEKNVPAIRHFYDQRWKQLTDQYYSEKNSSWPDVEYVSSLCKNNKLFVLLYTELFHRHLYVTGQATGPARVADAYNNFMELFEYAISSKDTLNVELPFEWVYDIINEFVYSFQSFCQVRANQGQKSQQGDSSFIDSFGNSECWDATKVITILRNLTNAANIDAEIRDNAANDDASDGKRSKAKRVSSQFLFSLGYFAKIGEARVHLLLGDYRMVLSTLSPINLRGPGLYTRVISCHIMLFYCSGFSYMMLHRYVDAAMCFVHILTVLARFGKSIPRTLQKKHNQVIASLVLVRNLQPDIRKKIQDLAEGYIRKKIQDLANDKVQSIRGVERGEKAAFQKLFKYAAPKFIVPAVSFTELSPDAHKSQSDLFMQEVQTRINLVNMSSYLKLYTSVDMEKLARLRGVDNNELLSQLICLKHKNRSLIWRRGDLLTGQYEYSSNVSFHLDGTFCHVTPQVNASETDQSRSMGKYFISESNKLAKQR